MENIEHMVGGKQIVRSKDTFPDKSDRDVKKMKVTVKVKTRNK